KVTNFNSDTDNLTVGQSATLGFDIEGALNIATVTINKTPVGITPASVPVVGQTPGVVSTPQLATLLSGANRGNGEITVKPTGMPSTKYTLCFSDSNHAGED